MNDGVLEISLSSLAIAALPVVLLLLVLHRWSLETGKAAYAVARMLLQLLLIGFVLNFLFTTEQAWIIVLVLTLMLMIASWIALQPLQAKDSKVFLRALISITLGGIPVLILVTQAVIGIEPWYNPRYLIPLAGMIFAGAMNAVSLAAERWVSELQLDHSMQQARGTALRAALIPLLNSLFAVGLVSLPGMMTGQILSGVDPLTAARYQIVVMCMLFSASGLAAACYLSLANRGRTDLMGTS